MDEALSALVAEATAKSGIVWLSYAGEPRPRVAWHVWLDGSAYVISGGTEQPLPGIEGATEVTVTVASKDAGSRLLTWVATARTVRHGSADWHAAAAALSAKRLNGVTADRLLLWSADSTITRLTPTGQVPEHPGARPQGDHAAPPVPTGATTRGPLPRVFHRRQRRSPKL